MSCFLFADSILRVGMLRVIVQGKFSAESNRLENRSVGSRDFSVKVQSDFLVLFKKKRSEIK